jgi:hypothetical protein
MDIGKPKMGCIFSKGGGNTLLKTKSSSPKGLYLGEKMLPGGLSSSIFGGASSSDEEEDESD